MSVASVDLLGGEGPVERIGAIGVQDLNLKVIGQPS